MTGKKGRRERPTLPQLIIPCQGPPVKHKRPPAACPDGGSEGLRPPSPCPLPTHLDAKEKKAGDASGEASGRRVRKGRGKGSWERSGHAWLRAHYEGVCERGFTGFSLTEKSGTRVAGEEGKNEGVETPGSVDRILMIFWGWDCLRNAHKRARGAREAREGEEAKRERRGG